MKNQMLRWSLLCLLTVAGSQRGLAVDGVIVANDSVPVSSLGTAALKDLLLGKTVYWEGGQAVVIVVVADKTDAALQEVAGMSPSQFKTYWQRLTFSGRGQQPKTAADGDKAVAMVAATKGAIAIVPPDTKTAGVKKIELQDKKTN